MFESLEVEIRIKGDAKVSKHVVEFRHAPITSWLPREPEPMAKISTNMLPMLQQWVKNENPMCERHPQIFYSTGTARRTNPAMLQDWEEQSMHERSFRNIYYLSANPVETPLSHAAELQILATTLVCKQIYLETALLPFHFFTFSSEHLSWLSSWMQLRLFPPQRNAITVLKMRLELVIYQSWARMIPRGGSFRDTLSIEPSTMKMLASHPHLKRLVLTDFDSWRSWSHPTAERVQKLVREATGMENLVVERSEERMFGGG